jgi:hypothetical protein
MKMTEKTVTLGFEYLHPVERRVLVDITYTHFQFNWFERVKMRLFNKAPVNEYTKNSRIVRVLMSQKMGFRLVAMANRMWNLTDETIIKDRYNCDNKTGKIDKSLFDHAEHVTLDKLLQDINNGSGGNA